MPCFNCGLQLISIPFSFAADPRLSRWANTLNLDFSFCGPWKKVRNAKRRLFWILMTCGRVLTMNYELLLDLSLSLAPELMAHPAPMKATQRSPAHQPDT